MARPAGKSLDELIVEGNALEDRGELEAALALYREALTLAPDAARVYVNIGNALQLMGRIDDAITAQERAVQFDANHAAAHSNLGALLARKKDYRQAKQELQEALRLKPDLANARIVLADILKMDGHLDAAEIELRRVLESSPPSAIAAHNLALLVLEQGRLDEAEAMTCREIARHPDFAPLHALLGTIYVGTGRARDAEPLFRKSLSPPSPVLKVASSLLLSLNFRHDLDAESVFQEHRRIGAMFDAAAGPVDAAFEQGCAGARPLKIGYVSADFCQHPVGLFIRPILERHDRAQFDVHCYANNSAEDDLTRRLERAAPHWHSIAGLGDDLVESRIRDDDIDILVDLSGHTSDSRLAVFARRAAPVQVTWLAYLNTTGIGAMDYRICDSYTDPSPTAETLHTERLYRLPHSQWCYEPVYSIPKRAQPRRDNPGALIFGSFNQFAKISDACLALWSAVLRALPAASLRVYGVPEGRTRASFLGRLADHGVDPARAALFGRTGILEYFGAIADVDIALDTVPYNGATTTLDVLWIGVPIVGLRGAKAISRGTFSILSSLGAPELIATTLDEFVGQNVRLARDVGWRRELRESLRERLESSPLMDATRFVRDLEEGYRRMWQTWCLERTQATEI